MGIDASAAIEVIETDFDESWRTFAIFPNLPRNPDFFRAINEAATSTPPRQEDLDDDTRDAWRRDGGRIVSLTPEQFDRVVAARPNPWPEVVAIVRAARALEPLGQVRVLWWYDT